MANPPQMVQEKVKGIMVEGDREKEKEVSVRHEIIFPKWKTWDCINFTGDWNKNYFA